VKQNKQQEKTENIIVYKQSFVLVNEEEKEKKDFGIYEFIL